MTTAQTTPEATTTAQTTFKDQYNEALGTQAVGAAPRLVGEAVLAIMDSKKVPVSFSKLTKEIGEAAARNDIDAVLKLSHDLKNVKDNEGQNKKAIQELATKFKFHDVVQAFQAEFEELAYQIAHKALTETHVQLVKATKKTRSTSSQSGDTDGVNTPSTPRKKSLFKVTKADGTVVDFPVIMGPKGNTDYKAAEEAYKALGFEVKKDGDEYVVEPGTIELKAGGDVMVNRVNLMEAIEKQTSAQFDGWKVEKVKID